MGGPRAGAAAGRQGRPPRDREGEEGEGGAGPEGEEHVRQDVQVRLQRRELKMKAPRTSVDICTRDLCCMRVSCLACRCLCTKSCGNEKSRNKLAFVEVRLQHPE